MADKVSLVIGINTKKYHVFAPMGRFHLELIGIGRQDCRLHNKVHFIWHLV